MVDDAQQCRPAFALNSKPDSASQRLQLLQRLLSSQEPAVMVSHFFDALAPRLGFAGLTYTPPYQRPQVELGTEGRHQSDYALKGENQNLGHMTFHWDRRFNERQLAEVEEWLSVLFLPLSNALRYQDALRLALVDSLTGLGNRAALDTALHRELRLAERQETELSMLIVDVDHFKKINDHLGHSRGDEILKQVANLMSDTLRDSDLLYRYGGEEFVVLLSNTGPAGAAVIAERLRRTVAQVFARSDRPVTVSMGISSRRPEGEISMHSLFDRADQALYRAKAQGRNRVEPEIGATTQALFSAQG
ncbi:GGDEF domain-containing protein [Marinimicrobium agarilyticum]|uniref:GGDEF domain-containing protein n=1 Tax=Marinimicrobium agarilyticum TaxID=306546 RepID=UPI00042917BF|nr:GGDEF domain-containing protein [Marinimicrobium agarilyticum]